MTAAATDIMQPLPIDAHLPRIVSETAKRRALVLAAAPGAGKTTRVPPALLAARLLSPEHPNLVMLQPRRVAARAAAERIADERGWSLGREVGYHVRFEKKLTAETRLRVVTEGILTRQLLDDPFLSGIGAVVLDEFHERSLHTDLALAMLREVRQTVRDDLVIVVMSATLDAAPVAKYLGDCPIVDVEGRTFPVEITYRPPTAQSPLAERAATATADVLDDSSIDGDVLVFLPGAEEIRRTMNRLSAAAERANASLLPLHGSLPFEQQALALRPTNRRRVILSTNIAETSLTIEGVRIVIDAGYARVASFDAGRGLDRLDLQRISQASATQRAGRAGRTAPGRCIRLWSANQQAALAPFDEPEVRRVDLCGTVLALHAWGKPDPRAFEWFEPPPEETLRSAERTLAMLGALSAEENGQITPLGRQLMSLPAHPRIARLLVAAAERGMAAEGAAMAALLSEKDIIRRNPDGREGPPSAHTTGPSDLLYRLELLEHAERSRFAHHLRDGGVDPIAARQVARTRDSLLRLARRVERATSPRDDETLLKLALLAYPDRVCRRRPGDERAATMVGGGGVRLGAETVVWRHEFFLALDAQRDERTPKAQAVVRIASGIELEWLTELFPQHIRRETAAEFDESRGKVVGKSRLFYRDLLLSERLDAAVDADAAAAALGDALRSQAVEIFQQDAEAANVLARVELLRRRMPEKPWPMFDAAQLGDILAAAVVGKRGVEDVKRQPLGQLLMAYLPYPLDRLLEEHAPTAIEVPTGNRIKIDYTGGKPTLAVRLQELFGWTDTPRVAGGRVPVLLHLLGPNYRPVQITDDLRSFWSTTYFQVRKDLRVRYPKHSWPEDPMTATPQAKGGRRRP